MLLEASCDGWGEAVNYSRTGFNRSDFMNNLIKARPFVNRINCVVNIYSVWTLPYIEKICGKFGIKPVYTFCQILNLKDFLEDKMNLGKFMNHIQDSYKFKDYINTDKPHIKSMIKYNLMLDKYHGTDFSQFSLNAGNTMHGG